MEVAGFELWGGGDGLWVGCESAEVAVADEAAVADDAVGATGGDVDIGDGALCDEAAVYELD